MTVIVGLNWFSEVVMIADTRVSWERAQYPPQDILRKLYTIGNANNSVVLGFSGNLDAVQIVMTHLKEQKFKNIKRRFVVAHFKDSLRGWIEEVTTTKLTSQSRKGLKFMLCGIEPSRHPPVIKQGQTVKQAPFPETHIYVYNVQESTGKVSVTKKGHVAVIGTGRELEKEIRSQAQRIIKFGFKQSNLHWARAFLISDIVASLFRDINSTTVGGPFQTIRISPNGLEEQFVWPPNVEDKNVEITREKSRVKIYHPSLKEQYTLYPIWEFPF